jgi:hypothetical protein
MGEKNKNKISFYLPLEISRLPALRQALNHAAARAGFFSTHGPNAGRGSFAAAMLAIAEGKARLVIEGEETDQGEETMWVAYGTQERLHLLPFQGDTPPPDAIHLEVHGQRWTEQRLSCAFRAANLEEAERIWERFRLKGNP